MNKFIFLILLLLVFLLLIGTFIKDFIINFIAKPTPPNRINGVPESAIWYGGIDGGVWITCKDYKNKVNLFYCKIYNDHTGKLEDEGVFKYNGDKSINLKTLKNKISSYDGMYIYLNIIGSDGRNKKLRKINKNFK